MAETANNLNTCSRRVNIKIWGVVPGDISTCRSMSIIHIVYTYIGVNVRQLILEWKLAPTKAGR